MTPHAHAAQTVDGFPLESLTVAWMGRPQRETRATGLPAPVRITYPASTLPHARRPERNASSSPASHLVGRDVALANLRARIIASDSPRVGVLTGVAGVGKSALAAACMAWLRAEGRTTQSTDLEDTRSTAEVVFVELDSHSNVERAKPRWRLDQQCVVLITRGIETAYAVSRRLGEANPWTIQLEPLSPLEASRFLERLGLRGHHAVTAARRAAGNPMLLEWEAARHNAPSVVSRSFVRRPNGFPADLDLAWLSASIVRRVSETLLRAMLDPTIESTATAARLFELLRTHVPLRFEDGSLSLPESLRSIALDELRMRAPERRTQWARRAQDTLLQQLETAALDEVPALVADLLYACRFEPHGTLLCDARTDIQLHVDDSPAVRTRAVRAVERFEGARAAQLLQAWWSQPGVRVVESRDGDGRPVGFALNIALHPHETRAVDDPVIEALCAAVTSLSPALLPEDRMVIGRFWLDYERFQLVRPTAVQWGALVATDAVISASVHHDAEHWRGKRDRPFVELASAVIDGATYAVFGLDRRFESTAAPFARMVARCRSGARATPSLESYTSFAAPSSQQLKARDHATMLQDPAVFAELVRNTLRQVFRADKLAKSPLLSLRTLQPRASEQTASPASILVRRLGELVDRLGTEGHDGMLANTLRATYFSQPERKGLAVADSLGMAHSTYRRWLRVAIARLAEQLRTVEQALQRD